jgi:protein-S-isoprenylcysteine O-methyltransferase Ste14
MLSGFLVLPLATLIAWLMWVLAYLSVQMSGPEWRRSLALLIAVVGAMVCVVGVLSFRRAGTTVNPLKPESATSLVIVGIYCYIRNPIYWGFLCGLLAWVLVLGSLLALLDLPLFVIYMNRFQICPEEQSLAKLFGSEYHQYRLKVRRW